MAIGFYIVPMKRATGGWVTVATRYCAMDDYTQQIIYTYDGAWTESEILGNRAIVKVRAPAQLLEFLDTVPGFRRLPRNRLNDSLADLPTGVKSALRDELLDMGYTMDEVHDRFGSDLGQHTLGDVLRFMATRRLKPRYNPADDTIYVDGEVQACRSIESVDEEVQE